jgi:hypothetical protein
LGFVVARPKSEAASLREPPRDDWTGQGEKKEDLRAIYLSLREV